MANDPPANFPDAAVRDRVRIHRYSISWMWLATLFCVLLAIGLVWHAWEPKGVEVSIRFPDGHGLKPGDALQHRGIQVGTVESVELDDGLDGIRVDILLERSAEGVARKGARFWIVRPQFDFTGVSGLETAVGAKYVAVIPGGGAILQTEFEGLASRPPESLGTRGLEVILRGDDRFGVHVGAPVTWRGVPVGQVLSSSLSPDAMHVDTRVRLAEAHRRLLTRESKFWVTSGIRMDLDVTGFELTADSLATIAQGGIAFTTPGAGGKSSEVRPGDVFVLHAEMEKEWLEAAVPMNVLELDPPPVAIATASWTGTIFGISRDYSVHASALAVVDGATLAVSLPQDIVTIPEDAKDGTFKLTVSIGGQEVDIPGGEPRPDTFVTSIPLQQSEFSKSDLLPKDRIRKLDQPEDCFVVRKSWQKDDEDAIVIELIGREELRRDGSVFRVEHGKLSRSLWHGAAVVASHDEKVIGMLLVLDDGPIIASLPPSK